MECGDREFGAFQSTLGVARKSIEQRVEFTVIHGADIDQDVIEVEVEASLEHAIDQLHCPLAFLPAIFASEKSNSKHPAIVENTKLFDRLLCARRDPFQFFVALSHAAHQTFRVAGVGQIEWCEGFEVTAMRSPTIASEFVNLSSRNIAAPKFCEIIDGDWGVSFESSTR